MFIRNILVVIGVVCMIAGVTLSVIWLNQMRGPTNEGAVSAPIRPAVLIAAHSLPAGALLRAEDMIWKEVEKTELRAGYLIRGQQSEMEFLGATTRRQFVDGQPFVVNELLKPSDRQFLATVLRPDMRAVSIAVDALQSASGLVRPGDMVDVILTQSFGEPVSDPAHKSVGETVLRDTRVIAVDQSLSASTRPVPTERGVFDGGEARLPKTVTLELSEREAEILFVAAQLGRIQLSIRPLAVVSAARREPKRVRTPTWASDVSPALKEMAHREQPPPPSGSTVERAVRRPPNR